MIFEWDYNLHKLGYNLYYTHGHSKSSHVHLIALKPCALCALPAAHLGLQPASPVRNLRDLFITYEPYPQEILPFVCTACVIDAMQATAYLGHAVVWLYRAIDYNGLECPSNTPAGCAISVAGRGTLAQGSSRFGILVFMPDTFPHYLP